MQMEPAPRRIPRAAGRWRDLVAVSRPRQWVKNGYVFAALIFVGNAHLLQDLPRALWAAAAFCLISSSVYVLNDIADAERDGRHPLKRLRPIASGSLSPRAATPWMVALLLGGLSIGLAAGGPPLALILAGYCVMNVVYSFRLKHLFLFDAATVATGFVLRAAAGAEVLHVTLSPWLFLCTTLLSLFLAFGKRRSELTRLGSSAGSHRRVLDEYSVAMLDQFISITVAAIIAVYAVYTYSAARRHALMLTLPFVLYGLFRYLYILHRGLEGESPDEALASDRPTLVNVFLWAAASALILYRPFNLF